MWAADISESATTGGDAAFSQFLLGNLVGPTMLSGTDKLPKAVGVSWRTPYTVHKQQDKPVPGL